MFLELKARVSIFHKAGGHPQKHAHADQPRIQVRYLVCTAIRLQLGLIYIAIRLRFGFARTLPAWTVPIGTGLTTYRRLAREVPIIPLLPVMPWSAVAPVALIPASGFPSWHQGPYCRIVAPVQTTWPGYWPGRARRAPFSG